MAITPMNRRGTESKGKAAPLFDMGDWTLSIGSDWLHSGSHHDFKIILIHRIRRRRESMEGWKGAEPYYIEYKHRHVTIPTLKWKTMYRHRRWMMWYYKFQQKVLWWLVRR